MNDKKNEIKTTDTAAPVAAVNAPGAGMVSKIAEPTLAELVATPAGIFDPRVYAAVMPIAEMMARSGAAVPEWARNNPGGCYAVCIDALCWGVNPYGLIKDTASVNGGLPVYGGKSTYAIIKRIVGDLRREYIGDWTRVQGKVEERIGKTGNKYFVPAWKREDEEELGVVVWRNPDDKLTLMLRQCTVRNSTNWANNPMVQILYQAYKVWARINEPGAILGFYTVDEMPEAAPEMQNITPAPGPAATGGKVDALKERLGVKGETVTDAEEVKGDAPASRKRSEIIAEELAASGAPITLDDVKKYLAAQGIADVDDDNAWSLAARRKFDADPHAAVASMATKIADSLI